MTRKEKLIFDVLQYAQLTEMPESTEKVKDMWVYAIARILDRSNDVNYAIIRNIDGKRFSYIKMFGTKGVFKVLSIHPYKFLDMSYATGIRSEEDMRKFVAKAYGVKYSEVGKVSKEELLRLFFNYGIKLQTSNEISPVKQAELREKASEEAEKKTEIIKPKTTRKNGKLRTKTGAEA